MWQPCGDVDEVACASGVLRLAMFSPADEALAGEDVDDGVLFAMVVDAGACAGFDEEGSAPQLRGDAGFGADGGLALRAGGLLGAGVELIRVGDAYGTELLF